jgi:hypothetical protein
VINRLQTRATFYRFLLHPTPVAAEELLVDFEREIQDLADPADEPMLPLDFHDLIALLARADEYEFKSDDRWGTTREQAIRRVKELTAWVDNHDIYQMHAVPYWEAKGRGPAIGGAATGAAVAPAPLESDPMIHAFPSQAPLVAPGQYTGFNWFPLPLNVRVIAISAVQNAQEPTPGPARFNLKHKETGAFICGTSDPLTWPTISPLDVVTIGYAANPSVTFPAGTSLQTQYYYPPGSTGPMGNVTISVFLQPAP